MVWGSGFQISITLPGKCTLKVSVMQCTVLYQGVKHSPVFFTLNGGGGGREVSLSYSGKIFSKLNAEATFVQSMRMQRFLKVIATLSCWYSFERSH